MPPRCKTYSPTFYNKNQAPHHPSAHQQTPDELTPFHRATDCESPSTTGAWVASHTLTGTSIVANGSKPSPPGCNLKSTSFCFLKCNPPTLQLTPPKQPTHWNTTPNRHACQAKVQAQPFNAAFLNQALNFTYQPPPINPASGSYISRTHP